MKEIRNILEECSINDIYFSNRGASILYKIPIYQRNYAWEREEIYALIKDVYDSLKKPVYYIGTLVTYKRDENIFEVIDGQQRLTTIYIILKALGIESIANTLTYSARKVSAATIEKMPNFSEENDQGILSGFQYAKESLSSIVGDKKAEIDAFKDYFLNNVHIIHYRVPKDVDLNHYFEVMNSRGEQLEKHEIVKAKLSEQLIGDDVAMEKFSRIWEACSDMSFYIQQKLPGMTSVFGNTMDSFDIKSFDEFPNSDAGSSLGKKTISELLNAPIRKLESMYEDDQNDSFQPIIDFPNFLLIVLKITRMWNEEDFDPLSFTLDDKELIKEFEKINLTPEFVKDFAFNLLLAKYYLDNYVIHHTDGVDRAVENPWKLQYYYKKGNSAAYLKDLYESNKAQEEAIQLLSMFEVAFTPKQRKNYLFYCLYHLFEDWNLNNYLVFLRNLAKKYFFDVYLDANKLNDLKQPKPNSFDETILIGNELNVELEDVERDFDIIYPVGACNIPLYVFNYTDYKLWKKYADELRGKKTKKGSKERTQFFEELGCSDFELDPFNNFYFSRTRKSLEHYYPQAKAGEGKQLSSDEINCFGNFAMIGSDANSSGSNWNPIDKKNRYLDTKSNQVSVASLKFRIMLQICQDNYDAGVINEKIKRPFGLEWNYEDIQEHQRKMLDIIIQ